MIVPKYTKLSDLWKQYRFVIKAKPYNPDTVQAWGLAFAGEWNERADDICKDFDINPEEFDYSLRYDIMKRIIDG